MEFKLYSKVLFLIFLYIGLVSCEHDHSHHNYSDEVVQVGDPNSDTRALVTRAHQNVNPSNISYYLNRKRADQFLRLSETMDGIPKVNMLLSYNLELLKTGETEQAIKGYKELIIMLQKINRYEGAVKNKVLGLLGISYFRLGEQQNCLENHNENSCILPLAENAIHTNEFGSQNAIEIFELLLDEFPQDSRSKYILNLAYMTLGKYPDKVPTKYLIPPTTFESNSSMPRFKNVAMGLGVDVNGLSGGSIIDDFNNDGFMDIVCSSWGFEDNIRYFENDKNGGFVDKTNSSGLVGHVGGLNINHTDYNNDGYKDIYIMRGAWMGSEGRIPNTLLRNEGNGTFKDVTLEAGLNKHNPTQSSAWADLNLDGNLDLVIANEVKSSGKQAIEAWINKGNGTFFEMADSMGLSAIGFFKGIQAGDIDGDGWTDLYFSNYNGENYLFINSRSVDPFKLKFFRVSSKDGLSYPINSFPAIMFDFDNNGAEDIFVSGYGSDESEPAGDFLSNLAGKQDISRSPALYRNLGGGRIEEVSNQYGLDKIIYTMGCNFGDINVDGYPDLYLGSGDPSFFSVVPNQMFLNNKGQQFVDVTFAGGFGHIQKGHAISFGDLDNDGDQDIYAVMGGAYEGDVFQNVLYENPNFENNNWISLDLVGSRSNKAAIGARVLIEVIEKGEIKRFFKTITTGASFGSNSLRLELGIGKATAINRVSIKWPTYPDNIQAFRNLQINTHYKLVEGQPEAIKLDLKPQKFELKKGHHHHNH